MKRRDMLVGACVAAAASPLAASSGFDCADPGPQTLSAAGTLLLLATAEHGSDGLRMAMLALAQQASPGCEKKA